MQVTLIKLSKFISSPKILKANQMLITYFPYITLAIVLLVCTCLFLTFMICFE